MIAVILISAGVFALCAALRRRLSGSAPRFLFRDKIQLDPMYNRGAAFGLKLKGPVLNVLSAAALGMLALLAASARGLLARLGAGLGAGLALGGGLSNLYERLRGRGVLDYLRFPRLPGRVKQLVFNAADLAIFAGLLLMLLDGGKKGK